MHSQFQLGVIRGMPKEKQVWLKAGDQVGTAFERPGELRFVPA